jgi:hypothetical protein
MTPNLQEWRYPDALWATIYAGGCATVNRKSVTSKHAACPKTNFKIESAGVLEMRRNA